MNANLLLDPLSITFVLLITGVGSLIHIYSIGYMAHDPEIWGRREGRAGEPRASADSVKGPSGDRCPAFSSRGKAVRL